MLEVLTCEEAEMLTANGGLGPPEGNCAKLEYKAIMDHSRAGA